MEVVENCLPETVEYLELLSSSPDHQDGVVLSLWYPIRSLVFANSRKEDRLGVSEERSMDSRVTTRAMSIQRSQFNPHFHFPSELSI
jgi:hypothetical protein